MNRSIHLRTTPGRSAESQSARSSRAGAFTLIELLALVCIVTLLVVLAIPMHGNTRVRSHVSVCQNNLRQLAMGWRMYAEDNADNVIGFGDSDQYSWRVRPGQSYFNSFPPPPSPPVFTDREAVLKFDLWGYRLGGLYRYASSTNILLCPANWLFQRETLPLYASYSGIHGFGTQSSQLSKTTQVLHPAERFLWVEEGEGRAFNQSGFTFLELLGAWQIRTGDPPNPDDGPTGGITSWWDSPTSRHLNGANHIYADGHVEWRQWEDLDTLRFALDPPWGRAHAGMLNVTNDLLFFVPRYPSALNP